MAKYHALREEVTHLEESADIDIWLRLRMKGFKFSLLNELSSWGLLFKYYLQNKVVDSLQELEEFCEQAHATMSEKFEKDDLKSLLKIMALLTRIEERTLATDQMFGPLKDIVQMLKEYQFVFGSKVYTQVNKKHTSIDKCEIFQSKIHTVRRPTGRLEQDQEGSNAR